MKNLESIELFKNNLENSGFEFQRPQKNRIVAYGKGERGNRPIATIEGSEVSYQLGSRRFINSFIDRQSAFNDVMKTLSSLA